MKRQRGREMGKRERGVEIGKRQREGKRDGERWGRERH